MMEKIRHAMIGYYYPDQIDDGINSFLGNQEIDAKDVINVQVEKYGSTNQYRIYLFYRTQS